MRKTLSSVVCLLCILLFGCGRENIENPGKPQSKDSGRMVVLEEAMVIRDTGENFYFKYPRNLKVAPDGSLFVQDQEQFIQFGPDGKFVRNLFKMGQGPGEMQSAGNYFFEGEHIVVHEQRSDKILCFDFDGKLITDFKIQGEAGLSRFLFSREGAHYFLSSDRPAVKKTSVVDIHQKLIGITREGKETKELTEFPTTGFIAVGKQGGRVFYGISSVIAVPYRKKFLFVSHTQEYSIKLYDAEKDRVLKTFKRDYRRVKTPPDAERTGGAMLDGKQVSPPPQKFLNDIRNLIVSNDLLWVVTSTTDEEKGTLIDVFDSGGKYRDNFYLKFPENMVRRYHGTTAMAVSEDSLFAIEQDEDGTFAIKKYKIEDSN